MSAQAIFNYMQTESGRFGPEIYYRRFAPSLFNELIVKGEWMDEMGDTIHNMTYERTAPVDAVPTWYPWAAANGAEGGSCITPAEYVPFGSTDRSYSLERRALIGDPFCIENLRSAVMLEKQLIGVMKALGGRIKLEWEVKNKIDYDRIALNKAVFMAGGLVIDQTGLTNFLSGSLASSKADTLINQGGLDLMRESLLRDGADDAAGMVNGVPILTLHISAEASNALLFQNLEYRNDLRWGNPSQLLKAYGVTQEYKGFFHVIDPYPRRFSSAGVEVPTWISQNASKGKKSVINPDWTSLVTAPIEEGRIFSPAVFTRLFPRPISSAGAGFNFDPVAYNGDWEMLNIKNIDTNPKGTIITPYGILGAAAEPVSPERGWVFQFKRCNPPYLALTVCP